MAKIKIQPDIVIFEGWCIERIMILKNLKISLKKNMIKNSNGEKL